MLYHSARRRPWLYRGTRRHRPARTYAVHIDSAGWAFLTLVALFTGAVLVAAFMAPAASGMWAGVLAAIGAA